MRILIMASGRGERWKQFKSGTQQDFKPLIDIFGETINNRINQQLESFGHKAINVVSDPQLAKALNYKTLRIPHTKSLVASILAVKRLWRYPLLILMGDVVYHPSDLKNILKIRSKKPLTFFGRDAEIYAMQVTRNCTRIFNKALPIGGKLRDVRYIRMYNQAMKMTLTQEKFSRKEDPAFTYVQHWTRDIDHNLALNYFTHLPEVTRFFGKEQI